MFIKSVINEASLTIAKIGAKSMASKLQEKLIQMEQDNIPLTYHNLNAILEQIIQQLD